MAKKLYGRTRSGRPITDELIEELAKDAEAGFDVDAILRRRSGWSPIDSSAASVESVRLDHEFGEGSRQHRDEGIEFRRTSNRQV